MVPILCGLQRFLEVLGRRRMTHNSRDAAGAAEVDGALTGVCAPRGNCDPIDEIASSSRRTDVAATDRTATRSPEPRWSDTVHRPIRVNIRFYGPFAGDVDSGTMSSNAHVCGFGTASMGHAAFVVSTNGDRGQRPETQPVTFERNTT